MPAVQHDSTQCRLKAVLQSLIEVIWLQNLINLKATNVADIWVAAAFDGFTVDQFVETLNELVEARVIEVAPDANIWLSDFYEDVPAAFLNNETNELTVF